MKTAKIKKYLETFELTNNIDDKRIKLSKYYKGEKNADKIMLSLSKQIDFEKYIIENLYIKDENNTSRYISKNDLHELIDLFINQ